MTRIESLQRAGVRRTGSPKSGFHYRGATADALERIRKLRIPPAWTEVAIARSPSAKLQAVGRDRKDRWQYRYSQAAVREREERKYQRLLAFGRALPKMRAAIARGLRLPGLPHDKVLACIANILSTCFMRPGSYVYARENGSFGIATLQNRHARVHGDTVRFAYPGKSGKFQVRELRDRRVARIVRQLKKLPGRDLFQFVADDGAIVNIRRRHINAYIKDVMGENFSAKDFRTWAGTLLAARALARKEKKIIFFSRVDRHRLITAAVRETADQLGNTPAVCRSSYICPVILTAFEAGKVLRSQGERALLDLLRSGRTLH